MLTWFRKKQRSILKWTLILVIPSFVAFYGWSEITGADPMMEDPSAWWIRVRGDEGGWVEVSQWEFRQAKESLVNRYGSIMQGQFGQQAAQLTRQIEGLIDNKRIAMEAIDNAILRQYAEQKGLTVSQDEVAQMIQQQFRGATAQQARQFLAQQGLSEQQFAAQLQYGMLLEKAKREVTAPAFVSVYEAWQEYSLTNQKVKVAALEFNQSEFQEDVVIDEAALSAYFQENVETYRVPEKRAYEYVKIDRQAMADEIAVDEAALTAYHEANRADFEIPRGVKVRQIVLSVPMDADQAAVDAAKAELAALAERAKAGEDFAALADEHSQDFANTIPASPGSTETLKLGGLLDSWFTESTPPGRYGEEFIQTALALTPGQISEPVRTMRGVAILKGEEVREAEMPAFEEIKDEVESRYRDEKSREMFTARRSELAEAINDFTDLDEIAEAAGLSIQKTEPQNATSYMFPNLGNLDRYELYFTDLQQGDLVAGIMDIPNSDNPEMAVFMRLDSVAPTYLPELSEVRARVEGDYRRMKALDIARERAEATAAAVSSLEDLERAASESGKTLRQTDEAIRLDQIGGADLPRVEDFAADLVRTPVNRARVSSMLGFFGSAPSGYTVWIITEKEDADREAFREDMKSLQAELLNMKRQTLLNEFLASRREALKVEYNPMMLGDLAAN